MSRLSVRLRVVVAATLAMAVVLLALAGFLRVQVDRGLDAELGRALDARIGDVVAALADGRDPREAVPDGTADEESGAVQVLDRAGRVLAASPGLGPAPLLRGDALDRAFDGEATVDRAQLAVRDEDGAEEVDVRVRGRAMDDDVAALPVVVAAAPLEEHDATLRALDTALLVGVPAAIVLSALLGYALAASALRPVEAMRRRADAIDAPSDERLPVPPANDELARLGRTFNALLDRQAAGFRRERAFVADASHELRTPLAVLRTELDLAIRGDRDADELRAALVSASEETTRLERLADDLLTLARQDAGRPARLETVVVADLLEGVRARWAETFAAEGRALRVVAADAGAPPTVTGDHDDLERALTGLLDNALRHGAGETELAATAEDDGLLALHVRDRGPGVPAALRGREFDRFATGGAAGRERRGTGLGLSLVRAIAGAHGGRAGLDPRPGGGTDAWLAVSSNLHAAPDSVGTTP